ncbi:hypothetical protein FA13DRAFT_1853153 [Coprinellus micaceus]|uniref:F-box domain-containing protein n=1 Tax=Coprinellus micaceus TaxID=71717 RepID=A0A4Y7T9A0_COPMI|nr:hypothetical protein FA13DRAFT_1853153 [Coprinellus micaceus]
MAQESVLSPSGLTILQLPAELIEQCLRLCSNPTLIHLCRTSHFINELATRALYREISVCSVGALIRCCRTLAARPTTASALRSLSLYYPVSSTGYTQNLYDLIRRALDTAPELVHLRISTPDPRIVTALQFRSAHPELRNFHSQLTLSASLVEFLNQHPTLTSVEVSPFENTRLAKDCLPGIELPALGHFAGNAQILSKLDKKAKPRAAFISWDAMDQHPHLAIETLQSHNLRVLGCRRRGWNTDLFDIVSTSLPHILWLNVANLLAVDTPPTKEYLMAVKSHLTRFKKLQRLGLQCVDTWQMGDIQCVLEEDFQTVRSWGEACSSLQQIILPHSGTMGWYRVIDDLWIPDPRDQRGAAWLYRAVMRHEYPSWNRIVDCMKGRVSLCASTGEAFQQTQWTVRDSEMLVPSSSGIQAQEGSSSAKAWRDGSAHTAFVDL